MFKVTKDIYSVGVLNPNMRIFDIVMRTEYGTSYNSYIVKGSNKIALIDGCHEMFLNEYISHIEEVTPLDKIDYLIVNHCEPDHTGCLKTLLTKIPNIEIYCSAASKIFLTEITKLKLNTHVVKDREVLDLGNKTLEFILTPFLHWPDSIFTYCKEDKTIFTCDFLGSHYCEPTMIDKNITYVNEYKSSLKLYYDVIFSPFKKYARSGLDKLQILDVNNYCTSHGPILTKDCLASFVIEKYKEWSKEEKQSLSIPIFYVSSYGYTKHIAQTIKQTINEINQNIKTNVYDLNQNDMSQMIKLMNDSTAFCIGTPTLNKNALPPAVQLLSSLDTINVIDKNILVFGSYGWSGEAQNIVIKYLEGLKQKPFKQGIHIRFNPSKEQLDSAKNLIKEFIKFINHSEL